MRAALTRKLTGAFFRWCGRPTPFDKYVTGIKPKNAVSQCFGNSKASLCALIVVGFATPVFAFDGQTTPTSPFNPEEITPSEALKTGIQQYYSGDKTAALNSLQYAAENGQPSAAWKLGEMYAVGDGVDEDDLKAFQYYIQIIREHGADKPEGANAPFVRSAYVALGKYYKNGIDGVVEKNLGKAQYSFNIAAKLYKDAEAQYELGRLNQGNNSRMAVRWYNLAALKGHVGAQARLGETLYSLGSSEKKQARGLMWLTVAREQATGSNSDWINEKHEQYFALSSEPVREMARILADGWIERYRPDMLTAQQAQSQ
ncbi:MAG: tetratricopeptide repeat protein [Roseibium sp.]